ncbi:proline-rich protein 2-like [Ammospiza caudacuta]|uniref:proline-rich protein 2-like n=1 Tax=Ammospiza caudacuta TaxID=2857398 RepID=UPI002738CB32|nr:proline-rich protein 2-like [Ammospiza caudacuta]
MTGGAAPTPVPNGAEGHSLPPSVWDLGGLQLPPLYCNSRGGRGGPRPDPPGTPKFPGTPEFPTPWPRPRRYGPAPRRVAMATPSSPAPRAVAMAPPLPRCHGGPAPRGHVRRPRAGRPPPPDAPAMLRPPGPGACGTPGTPPGPPRDRPGIPRPAPGIPPCPRHPALPPAPRPGPADARTAATPRAPPRACPLLSGFTGNPGPLPGPHRDPPGLSAPLGSHRHPSGLSVPTGPHRDLPAPSPGLTETPPGSSSGPSAPLGP